MKQQGDRTCLLNFNANGNVKVLEMRLCTKDNLPKEAVGFLPVFDNVVTAEQGSNPESDLVLVKI